MAQGYAEQLPLYDRMRLIALEQEKNLLDEEINIDAIINNIASRQELINTLDNLNQEILKLKKEVCKAVNIDEFNISTIKAIIPGPGVYELAGTLEQTALLLEEIKDLDKRNEESLRQRITETRDKLTKIQGSKKADKAYQPSPANKEGVFIDFSK